MTIPDWWEAVLLTLAAWRVFHLLAFDDVLDRPRRYITRLAPSWRQEGDATGERYRERLAAFLVCPFCLGFWITVAVWAAWLGFPIETLWVAAPLALSGGLVGAQKLLSSG